jgi:hypothetical protein
LISGEVESGYIFPSSGASTGCQIVDLGTVEATQDDSDETPKEEPEEDPKEERQLCLAGSAVAFK